MKRCFLRLAAALVISSPPVAALALDLAGLDKSGDACSDLYGYANRHWLETTVIPDDRTAWSTGAIVNERNEKLLLAALAEGVRKPAYAKGTPQRKALEYYASGMDASAIAKAGLRPLDGHFSRASAVKNPQDLARAIAALHAQGIGAGFSFLVQADARDSSRYLAEIAQGGIGLPDRDYYFRDDDRSRQQRDAYVKHVARTLELAGSTAQAAARDAAVVMALETELARASMTAVEGRDPEKTYNKTALSSLAADAPGFPWSEYFRALGARELRELNVAQPVFAKAFARLASERPVEEWRVYLRWFTLNATSSKLTPELEHEHFSFYQQTLRGQKAPPPRARHVLNVISGPYGDAALGEAVSRIFVERAFSPESKARALQMVANIKAGLGDRIRTLDWMSPATREKALEKLGTIRVKIGYPDRWRDYSAADVGPHPFVENWLRANAFDHRRDLRRIGNAVDRDAWLMGAHIVNAYYEPRTNEIAFPAAILQPPLFDADADDAINYGGIGTVIGHEITHGFDDSGRLYDARGNMTDWWTQEDAARYLERSERIEKQYFGFAGVGGMAVNGKLTLGENIADQGGLKIAYLGLRKALAKSNTGLVDGLSPEQRFFLSYAQVWRSLMRDEQERVLLQTNPHSPSRFRVKGPIAHMPEFAQAFSCDPAKALLAEGARANIW
jgi:putative endopeptidase